MDKEKLFRRYLFDEMTQQEYLDFESLLNKDEALRQELAIHETLYTDRADRIKKSIQGFRKLKESNPGQENKPLYKMPLWLRMAAAVFILSFISYQVYNYLNSSPSQTTNLAHNYINKVHTPPPIPMGSEIDIEDAWVLAIEAYRTQQYEVVISQIQSIKKPNEEQRLYLGLSQLYRQNQDLASAESIFLALLEDKQSTVKDQALWYTALISLQKGDQEYAKSRLQQIVNSKSWKYTDALQLLKDLK